MYFIFLKKRFVYCWLHWVFVYLLLVALGLCCCAWTFSSYRKQGLLFTAVCRLLIEVASLAGGALTLNIWASVVVAHRLSSSVACGIFPDQESNPCPLHWGHYTTRYVPNYVYFKNIVFICS